MGKKPMSAFLKVNKYENPQSALDLISHICTAGVDLSVGSDFSPFYEKYSKIEEEYSEATQYKDYENEFVKASIDDLKDDCWRPYQKMPVYLYHSGFSDAICVAVGGGYSSGKSSFLNNITGMEAVLPTGIEPVSMINTYISFSDKTTKLIVSGENCKKHIVKLNREVLDCIQHSSKSKMYVSSVLNELYIKLPVTKNREYLKDLVFIDTPGYNNSDNANRENGKKDSDTALDALNDADALFWCIDIEAGTISQRDIEMLNELIDSKEGDFPFVVVFNKCDKKPDNEVVKILQAADKECQRRLKQQPVDIIAFSSVGESSVYSLKTKKKATSENGVMKVLASLFAKMKKGVSNMRTVSYWTNELASYFDREIAVCDEILEKLENNRKELAKKKAEAFRTSTTSDGEDGLWVVSRETLDNIKDTILDNYSEILEERNQYLDLLKRAVEGWEHSLDRETKWEDKVGIFSDASSLRRQAQNALNQYKKVIKAWNAVAGVQYRKLEDRQYFWRVVDMVMHDCEELAKGLEDSDSLNEEYDKIVLSKKIISEYKSFLQKKKREYVAVFTACCQNAIEQNEKRLRALQNIKEEDETDVFSAIANDNMNRFLDCFSSGVDLTKCNSQGFSPLTYVAKSSNNAMMKFLIAHDVDLTMKDKNGYNALETAAIYHCQDMCELLIQTDRGLVAESQSLTKLATNDRFEKWVSNF